MARYFAVQPNYECRGEYISKETALNDTDFLVINDDSAESKRTLIFKNEDGNSRIYISKGWKFEFNGFSRWPAGNFILARMVDPTGRIRETKFLIEKDWKQALLHGAIKTFLKYSSERDFRTVELLEENEKLRNEIIELRNKKL